MVYLYEFGSCLGRVYLLLSGWMFLGVKVPVRVEVGPSCPPLLKCYHTAIGYIYHKINVFIVFVCRMHMYCTIIGTAIDLIK